MKDWNRDQVARHLFDLMNEGRGHPFTKPTFAAGLWKWYVDHGFDAGYLRIADEIIQKGYRP